MWLNVLQMLIGFFLLSGECNFFLFFRFDDGMVAFLDCLQQVAFLFQNLFVFKHETSLLTRIKLNKKPSVPTNFNN